MARARGDVTARHRRRGIAHGQAPFGHGPCAGPALPRAGSRRIGADVGRRSRRGTLEVRVLGRRRAGLGSRVLCWSVAKRRHARLR